MSANYTYYVVNPTFLLPLSVQPVSSSLPLSASPAPAVPAFAFPVLPTCASPPPVWLSPSSPVLPSLSSPAPPFLSSADPAAPFVVSPTPLGPSRSFLSSCLQRKLSRIITSFNRHRRFLTFKVVVI